MTGLLVGCAIGAYIAFKLGYYDHLIDTLLPPQKWPLPSPDHLSCGQCFWITRRQWVGLGPFPQNLPDQLIISSYCEVHGAFAWKRWKEKHLDDAGIPDNYRGFLED